MTLFYMIKLISLTITLLFLGLGFILAILNPNLVALDLYWYQFELPLSLLMVISFVIGLLTAGIIFLSKTLKLKWQLKHHQKVEKKQLNEIMTLKKNLLDAQKQASKAHVTAENKSLAIEHQT